MSTFSELIVSEKAKSKWRESIFTVTINTNKSFKGDTDLTDLKKAFIDFLKKIFAEDKLKTLLIDLLKPEDLEKINLRRQYAGESVIYGVPLGSAPSESNNTQIKEITAHTQIESNLDNTAKLHSHTTIKVIHNSRLQVNTQLIQRVGAKYLSKYIVKKNGDTGSIYVRATGRNTSYLMENYTKEGKKI